ncbi:hypothetical protein DPMN_012597 [Dreissena polymorpha]|uniref:Uncharacterized protein n=1 Tax=Dreissena polymorpha TaxID=45954 RepID=A0A9D4N7B3_DREPO|nr:hypothetical protein DPMN_012597 [Dreissena polymorpha]
MFRLHAVSKLLILQKKNDQSDTWRSLRTEGLTREDPVPVDPCPMTSPVIMTGSIFVTGYRARRWPCGSGHTSVDVKPYGSRHTSIFAR